MGAEETWTLSLKDDTSANALKMAASQDALTASTGRLRDERGRFIAGQATEATALKSNANAMATGTAQTSAASQRALDDAKAAWGALSTVVGTAGGILKSAATGDIRGAIDGIGSVVGAGVDKLKNFLGSLGPYGQAAAAVLGVVTGALQATIGSMLDWAGTAIKMAEGKVAATAAWAALAGGEAAGKTAAGAIGKLGDALPFAGSQVRAWAQAMLAAGVSASQLEGRVKAVASAEALMRDVGGGGAAAQNLFVRLAESAEAADKWIKDVQGGGRKSVQMLADMGLSVKDVASALGMTEAAFAKAKISGDQMSAAVQKALTIKGAGSLEAMMGSWSVIMDKASGGWKSLFGGLGDAVKPMMAAVRSLFSEFNKGSVLMNILKPIVTAVFSKLFEWATIVADAAHRAFLMILIGGLQAYIAMRPLFAAFGSLWDAIVRMATAMGLMSGNSSILGSVLSFVGGIIVSTLGGFVTFLTMAVQGFADLINWITSFAATVSSALTGASDAATGAGGSIVDGLVAGVTGGVGAFVSSLTNLASQGLAAFEGIFRIKSPSKVMLTHGEDNIAGAAATGVDEGADKMDQSMARLGAPPKGGGGAGKGKRGEGSGITVIFDGCTFVGSIEEKIREEVMKMFREALAEAGAT